jgi:hypothetical protein
LGAHQCFFYPLSYEEFLFFTQWYRKSNQVNNRAFVFLRGMFFKKKLTLKKINHESSIQGHYRRHKALWERE